MTNRSDSSNYPRTGLLGIWDTVVGPGMSTTETLICLIPTLLATIGVPWAAIINQLDWNIWQLVISGILVFDLVGGAIVNVSSTTRQWHHRPEHGWKYHGGFVVLHLHPFLVVLLYPGGSWSEAGFTYSYLLIATLIILSSSRYFQRSISITLYLGSLVLSRYFLNTIPGMSWFLPVYFLKLLVSYLPQEHSFSP
jgi:hypothetical protein